MRSCFRIAAKPCGSSSPIGRKLNEGKLDKDTEIQLLPIFLTHIFEGLLGYIGPVSDSGFDAYTMKREMLIEVDGKRADAAFGQFGSGEEKYAICSWLCRCDR